VIDLVERGVHVARRALSLSRWVGRLHDSAGVPVAPSTAPGLLVIQIDGLSEARLRSAVAAGRMPFVARLLASGELQTVPVYPGLPSTTPAVQAELFYGVETAVPAFTFVDRATGRLMRMYQHDSAALVESKIAARSSGSLLAAGASYANVFTGGAADARFCMAALGVGDVLPRHLRWLTPMVALVYVPALVRIAAVAGAEIAGAPRDLVAAVRAGEDRRSETKFLLSRVVVGTVLREVTTLGLAVDLARGRPVVHGNFLGYDENAHRRGPDAPLALRALGPIDGAIARLWRAAHRSDGRAYDVWIMSDHGQELTDSYMAVHGETVADAIRRVAVEHGIVAGPTTLTDAPVEGVGRQRARLLGERVIARIVPGLDVTDVHHTPGALTVTAQGPVGHVYAPGPLSDEEGDRFARAIVDQAGVPLVLRRGERADVAFAHTSAGRFTLPGDASTVLGHDHPYRDEVAVDLVALCHHTDAGDLVISGWRPDGRSLSFPFEHGAHAGPGPQETSAFALVPPDTPLVGRVDADAIVRPGDLRRAGFAVLGGARHRPSPTRPHQGLRILTYNVHSCIGLDGRLSPERIARVIARHAPDVVALQELDVGRSRTGHLDQARAIADALEMSLAFHPTVSVADEQFGDAVLSPHPLRLVRTGALPGIGLEPRGAIWVEIELPGDAGRTGRLQLINTHFSLHPRERVMAADALLGPEWLGHPSAAQNIVVCGDFNALWWFPSLRRLSRRLTDAQRGLDGHRPLPTWFGRYPVGRIDHVLVDPRWTVLRVDVPDDTVARVASDHRPVVADIAPPYASGPGGSG
jgi:endonuclease/exonuclease/phosphatase family metal-dependent hydrolase